MDSDREKAIQEVERTLNCAGPVASVAAYRAAVDLAERAIRAERERDEAVRLLCEATEMLRVAVSVLNKLAQGHLVPEAVVSIERFEAFLAAHKGESNGVS